MTVLFAPALRRADGWARDVRIDIDGDGIIRSLQPSASSADAVRLPGPVIAGMPNLHSHAFQRAMAGLAEQRRGGDDFWSWRKAMYRFLEVLAPEDVETIAAQLYLEMAKAGYTRVCEFHYLHNAPDGRAYADPAAMAWALRRAARTAGLGLTLIPVLYTSGGFGGLPPEAAQRRFILNVDSFLALFETLRAEAKKAGDFATGISFHSLRAVRPEEIRAVLAHAPQDVPRHIHVAEQRREVENCLAWSGLAPAAWLVREVGLDRHWCLVHATYMTDDEAKAVARSGATVALCPSTEGNLGDGMFNADAYFAANGRFGIGTDSHIGIDPREELRLFEYGRRLNARRRALSADNETPHPGAWLWTRAAGGGERVCGAPVGRLEPSYRADFLVLDADSPALAGRSGDTLLDAFVFVSGPPPSPIREVWIGGQRVADGGRHVREDEITRAYVEAVKRLDVVL